MVSNEERESDMERQAAIAERHELVADPRIVSEIAELCQIMRDEGFDPTDDLAVGFVVSATLGHADAAVNYPALDAAIKGRALRQRVIEQLVAAAAQNA